MTRTNKPARTSKPGAVELRDETLDRAVGGGGDHNTGALRNVSDNVTGITDGTSNTKR